MIVDTCNKLLFAATSKDRKRWSTILQSWSSCAMVSAVVEGK